MKMNDVDDRLEKKLIKRIEDIGRIDVKLLAVLNHDLFENLSKHNPYWDHESEEVADKLYDIRCGLGSIQDQLYDIIGIIRDYEH